jgi:pentafunctional AROM polypeptide
LLPTKAAPGQLSFRDIQRALTLIGVSSPKKFYLFGTPIAHSMSPLLHNTGFEQLGLPHQYSLLETPEINSEVLTAIIDPSFGGASVTIPHKLTIIPHLTELSSHARSIGAVNTIVPCGIDPATGKPDLFGDNTDWLAIRDMIRTRLDQSITPTSTALVIGAGGTSRAAIYALHALGFQQIYLFNRTRKTAQAVVDAFPSAYNIWILDTIDKFPAGAPIAIVGTVPASATSISREAYGDVEVPEGISETIALPATLFQAQLGGVVVDMAYKPSMTPLLTLASERSFWKIVRGVDLLIEQGFYQFQLWTGHLAPKTAMRTAVMAAYDG